MSVHKPLYRFAAAPTLEVRIDGIGGRYQMLEEDSLFEDRDGRRVTVGDDRTVTIHARERKP